MGIILGRGTFGGDLAVEPRNIWAAPRANGLKLKGINIVPRPTDSGNYDAVTPSNVYQMCYDFCTEGLTGPCWLQWIKPQIDAAKSIGCDYVRWYWDATILVGDATHHGTAAWQGTVTPTQFADAIANVCNYLASQGMWYYPTAMEAAQADTGGAIGSNYGLPHFDGGLRLESAAILSYVDSFITEIIKYPNVWGVDVLMEFTRADWAMESTHLIDVMTQARTSRGSSTLPLTCSIWDGPPYYPTYNPGALGWSSHFDTLMGMCVAAQMDFFDLHIYSLAPGPFIDFAMNNVYNMPCVIGETGLTQRGTYFGTGAVNETVHPFSSELRTRHYQDVVASWGHRYDIQCMTIYGVVDQNVNDDGQKWGVFALVQDASYRFTSPKMEEVGPFGTIPNTVQPYNVEHVLDLSGPDTTYAAWASQTSFMVGWAQGDFANTFSRVNHKLRRANGAFGYGILDYYGPASQNQSISVDFNAADAVASGGRIDWCVSLRHPYLAPGSFFVAIFTSNPFDAAIDGLLSIWAVDGGYTQVATAHASLPLNLSHHFRLAFSATGILPTVLTATVSNLSTDTTAATVTASSYSPTLQAAGVPGIPSNSGQVDYTNVRYVATGDPGPSQTAPTVTATTTTSLALSWTAASGGITPYFYLPEYVALNGDGFPTAEWTTLAPQTGTTKTITGLSSSTRYGVRIQTRDNTNTASLGNRAYSPWLRVTTSGPITFTPSVVSVPWVIGSHDLLPDQALSPSVVSASWVVGAHLLSLPVVPPSMAAMAFVEVELAGPGLGWTDLSADVLRYEGIEVTRGISGGGPLDLMAGTGTARFVLNNSATNSAGLLGYYSRWNANARSGWDLGIACRIRYRDPSTSQVQTRFVGSIDAIDPDPGEHGARHVMVTATDFIEELARWVLVPGIGEQVDQTGDAILTAILSQMTRQPTATDFDRTSESYPYALDQGGINQSALVEVAKLAASELGPIYLKADGTLRLEDRHRRLLHTTVDWVLTDADLRELEIPSTRADIINTVRVTIHRRIVDQFPTTVVYDQTNVIEIGAGETKFLLGPYRDPATGDTIGATEVQSQIAGRDYIGNSKEDGAGTDVTADLTVVVTAGASGAQFDVTNNGLETAYLTTNQLLGRAIRDHGALTLFTTDSASVTQNGERAVTIDMPYQANDDVGLGASAYLAAKYAPSFPQARTVEVSGRTAAQLTQLLTRDISDRLTIVETVTGVSNDYFINGITETYRDTVLSTVFTLAPAADPFEGQYWILGTSVLGTDTVLAPF